MKKTILLADDDASIRRMVGRILEAENYEVLFARTGREAVSKFLDGPPNLVLLDLNMPDKDGWEAWRLMNGLHPMVPVIVITARPHQHAQAVQMRIDALMEKPLDLPLLLQTIRKLLAEPDRDRIARTSDPHFKTALLSASSCAETRSST
jgi:DNA-binding response OmpR family regulator